MKKFIEYSSPWAFLVSFSLMSTVLSLISFMKIDDMSYTNLNYFSLLFTLLMLIIFISVWFRDSFRESISGYLNDDIMFNTKFAVVLFLISEAFFFVTFFWMYMYSSLAPELDCWPPINLWLPSFMGAPTLNTILLVGSSATVTMSHFELQNKNMSLYWLILTLILSIFFIMIQSIEYFTLPMNITEGVGGSIFFMATGFHGMHVIIGSIALFISLLIMSKNYFSMYSLVSYELSIWYWHFVDAIWLMLYTIFYCWGH